MNNVIYVLFLAIISFIYIDYIAAVPLGIVISLIIFTIFAFISLKNLSLGIILSLFYSITIMEFPRNILDVYEALQVDKALYYNVMNTVKIGPLTLLVYLFFINTLLALYKLKGKILFERTFLIVFSTMFIIAMCSTMVNVLRCGDIFKGGMFITNIKWFLFIFMGYIQGNYLFKDNYLNVILKWFYLLPIFFGIRNILFLVNDFINATPKLDLMNQAYLSLIVLIRLIAKGNWGIYKNLFFRILLFVSLLNFSRTFLIVLVLSVLIAFFWNAHKKICFNFLLIINIIFIVGPMLFVLYLANERLFDFLLWKLNVFNTIFSSSGEMSGSGKVRILELQNIWYILSQNIYDVFFGKGFFATYNFEAFPLHNVGIIDLKSYSNDQLTSGVFYSTHSFTSSIILKYGIVGLLIYVFLPLYLVYKFYQHKQNLIFVLIPLILIYSYYWRIEFAFLIGILFGTIKIKETYEI